MKRDKFILTEQETLQLLTAFYKEGLDFIGVPAADYAEVINDFSWSPESSPISIDFPESRIYISIPFFRMMLALDSNYSNDGPTVYRVLGYQLAYAWYTYLFSGKRLHLPYDKECMVFAKSLCIIKGLPIPNTTEFSKVSGDGPYDLTPELHMLRNKFGIDCIVRSGKELFTHKVMDVVSFSTHELKRRGEQFIELYNENLSQRLPVIREGELGSSTNPFPNVEEAAAYILKLNRERLLSDRYRQMIADEKFYYDFQSGSFRISWASPNVAYYHIDGASYPYFVANQLSQTNNVTPPRFSLKPALRNNKFLYRGQAEFFSPCRPSLFRDMKKHYYVDDIIQINEMEVLLKEHPLVKLFEQGFYLMNEFVRFKINYAGLSQHYYNRTNLLDLTSDMEVAKFFAVTTFDMDNDCYVEYKGDKLGVLYYFDIQPDTFAGCPGRKYVVDSIGKQPFMRSGNQSGFLINLDRDDNFNNLPEVRYVYFRHDKDVTSRIFKASNNGDKYMPDEILRSHWHKRMSDKENRMHISTDALKLNFRNNPNESHGRILKELRKKGYKVSRKYKSAFTEAELNQYYEKSIQMWEDFCSNVHFYGPEGMLLKKHLLNLPDDPRYRWAFYRD